MANSNGWGDGAANNAIGWGQGANNNIGWGKSHSLSSAGLTDIVGLTTDSDAQAFITAAAITDATQQSAIDTLVKGLKSDGIWSKMKAVYPFVTDNRNLLGYTEDFSNAYWSKGGGTTVTSNTTTAPDGTTTADTITLPNNGTIAATLTNTSSLQTTFTIYLRASSNTTIKIGFVSPSVVTTCNVTTSWQRFTITHTFSGVTYPQIYNDTGSSVTLFAWGAQAEYAATATTYQPIATTQQAFIAAQFKYNLKDPRDLDAAFRLVFNGGWTHSSNGATPNGTNGYADTKLNPSISLASQNSSHMSYYSRTNNDGTYIEMGSNIDAKRIVLHVKYNGDAYYDQNDQTSGGRLSFSMAAINSSCFSLMSRTANNLQIGQVNGINKGINTNTMTSAMPNANIYVGAFNNSTLIYTNRQCAFSSIGDGLTDTESANLYTRVQAYQTALSRQV